MPIYLWQDRRTGRFGLASATFVCKCCASSSLSRYKKNLDQPAWQYLWTSLTRCRGHAPV